MNITTKYRTIRMYLAMARLITLGALSSICQAAKVIKATGEIIEGDVLGFLVLLAGSSKTEEGLPVPLYGGAPDTACLLVAKGLDAINAIKRGISCRMQHEFQA